MARYFFTRNGSHLIPLRDFKSASQDDRRFSARFDFGGDEHLAGFFDDETIERCFIIHEDGALFECDVSLSCGATSGAIEVQGKIHLERVSFSKDKILEAVHATISGNA